MISIAAYYHIDLNGALHTPVNTQPHRLIQALLVAFLFQIKHKSIANLPLGWWSGNISYLMSVLNKLLTSRTLFPIRIKRGTLGSPLYYNKNIAVIARVVREGQKCECLQYLSPHVVSTSVDECLNVTLSDHVITVVILPAHSAQLVLVANCIHGDLCNHRNTQKSVEYNSVYLE